MEGVKWVKMESARGHPHGESSSLAHTPTWGDRVASEAQHECIFYLKNKNQHLLEEKLAQVSDPNSPMYGKYMTKDEIDSMMKDEESENAIVQYVESIGGNVTKKTSSAITAVAPIRVWEQGLNTQFYTVQMPNVSHTVTRAREYSLPEHVAKHVSAVLNTVQLPAEITRGGPILRGGPVVHSIPNH